MSLEMSAGEFQIDFRAEDSAETARKQLLVSYYNKRVLIRVLIFDKVLIVEKEWINGF